MTSHPPGHCCTVGVKHEGTAAGEIRTIGKIESYVAYPPDKSTEHAIVIFPDVIGHKFINAQLIADQFAANGYFVVLPDLFNGDPVPLNRPPDFDLQKWLQSGHLPEQVDQIITSVLHEMRSTYGCKKIGSVGYCFGGKYTVRFAGTQNPTGHPLVDVGYTAHPSFVSPEELHSIQKPLSIAAAENDEIFPAEKRHETEEILKVVGNGEYKVPYEICLYGLVGHGFAVRGDVSDTRIKRAKEGAFIQAVGWLRTYSKGQSAGGK